MEKPIFKKLNKIFTVKEYIPGYMGLDSYYITYNRRWQDNNRRWQDKTNDRIQTPKSTTISRKRRKIIMEFIFVKTEEFKEFERDIKRMIKFVKNNAIKTILGSFFFYLSIVALIILLP